jgi:hypothetical protein
MDPTTSEIKGEDDLKSAFIELLSRVDDPLLMLASTVSYKAVCCVNAPSPEEQSPVHRTFRITVRLIAAVVVLVAFRWVIFATALICLVGFLLVELRWLILWMVLGYVLMFRVNGA